MRGRPPAPPAPHRPTRDRPKTDQEPLSERQGIAVARPLSVITEAEYKALSIDERLARGRQAERYRRAGNESSPAIRALKDRIHRGEGCALCGSTERVSIDHIIPIIRGGTHDPENLRILCGPCNSRKGGRG